MNGNFANCLAVTLGFEGGWSDHPENGGAKFDHGSGGMMRLRAA